MSLLQYVVLAAALLAAQCSAASDGARTWTSAAGTTVEAEYVRSAYGIVTLKKADGSVVRIAQGQLSPSDREWIAAQNATGRRTAAEEEVAGKAESRSKDELPVLTTGPRKGLYAAYETDAFYFPIEKHGGARLYLKDAETGAKTGFYFSIFLHSYYRDGQRANPRIAEFTTFSQPAMQPKKLRIKGRYDSGANFELNYGFEGDTVSLWGRCSDEALIYRIWAAVPASHKFSGDIDMAVIREETAGNVFVWNPVRGKVSHHPYGEPLKGLHAGRSAWIEGPVYGRRKVEFSAKSPDEGVLRSYIYSGYSPWQGYGLGLYKEVAGAKGSKHRMVISVE